MLAVITGASRGFGRASARALAERGGVKEMVLLSRSGAFDDTMQEVHNVDPAIEFACITADLGDMAELQRLAPRFEKPFQREEAGLARVLVNNAGSLHPLGPVASFADAAALRQAMDLNVVAPAFLLARFLAGVPSGGAVRAANISSLAAVQPVPTWGAYCAGKAGRDMVHAVAAAEAEEAGGDVRVINYAPGPLDTDMQGEIRASDAIAPALRGTFTDMANEGRLVDPLDSARRMVRELLDGRGPNGAHVDYFDEEAP